MMTTMISTTLKKMRKKTRNPNMKVKRCYETPSTIVITFQIMRKTHRDGAESHFFKHLAGSMYMTYSMHISWCHRYFILFCIYD